MAQKIHLRFVAVAFILVVAVTIINNAERLRWYMSGKSDIAWKLHKALERQHAINAQRRALGELPARQAPQQANDAPAAAGRNDDFDGVGRGLTNNNDDNNVNNNNNNNNANSNNNGFGMGDGAGVQPPGLNFQPSVMERNGGRPRGLTPIVAYNDGNIGVLPNGLSTLFMPPNGANFVHVDRSPPHYDESGKRILTTPVIIGRDKFSEVTYNIPYKPGPGKWTDGRDAPLCVLNNAPNGFKSKSCLPSWVVIGALKGGTSSLYTYMSDHPDNIRAKKKEVCSLIKASTHGGDPAELVAYRNMFKPIKFDPAYDNPDAIYVTGEGCPMYLQEPAVPGVFDDLLPNARIILSLRDPTSRLFSMFNMHVRYRVKGFKGDERLEDFVACERDSAGVMECTSHFFPVRRYIFQSRYAEQLNWWFERIPPSPRYVIVKAEDMFVSEQDVMDEIFLHVGMAPHELNIVRAVNAAPASQKITLDPTLRAQLEEYYDRFNQDLYSMLDHDFEWPRGGL